MDLSNIFGEFFAFVVKLLFCLDFICAIPAVALIVESTSMCKNAVWVHLFMLYQKILALSYKKKMLRCTMSSNILQEVMGVGKMSLLSRQIMGVISWS